MSRLITQADIEDQEWQAFKAKLNQRKRLFGAMELEDEEMVSLASGTGSSQEDGVDVETMDEDDVDTLLSLIGVMEDAKETKKSLTIAEIVRELQRSKVLSLEFPASARMQAQRMLGRLRKLNRVWVDPRGRWALL